MKIKKRNGLFETNSSSVHTLTILPKNIYDLWVNRSDMYLYTGSGYGWEENKPKINHVYMKEEVIDFMKRDKYYDGETECWTNTELYEEGFEAGDYEYDMEEYCENYTTESGDEIVVFGRYGYDG